MSKNPQKSVDSITDISCHVGMDARELKKQILYEALRFYRSDWIYGKSPLGQANRLGRILDIPDDKVTQAKKDRFLRVLVEMLDNAESKI